MKHISLALCTAALLLCGTTAHADTIDSRSDLAALLGADAVTIDFENILVNPFNQIPLGIHEQFDSSTVLPAVGTPPQGPGLLPDDIAFVPVVIGSGNLVINPPSLFPLDSTNTLSIAGGGGGDPPTALFIDFSTPVPAFGLDLLSPGLAFLNGNNVFNVSIYGANDTVSHTLTLNVPSPIFEGGRQFFGFSDAALIGGVLFQAETYLGVDDLTYGASPDVPEPASVLLIGAGVLEFARRRRRS